MQEESWNFAPVLIPLVALFIGWVIGFFDSNRRTDKKIKQAENSAQIAIRAADDKVAEVSAKLAAISANPPTVDDPGLMRIKNENGTLTLDLDGTRVNPSAFTAEQRKRLIEMLNSIRPWLEGKPAVAPAPATPSNQAPSISAQDMPAPASFTSSSAQPPAQTTTSKASSSKKKGNEPEPPPTSIVGQINLILQEQLLGTPLASRGVSMMESLSGGVNVYVGVSRYEGVDDVPDEEIKTAIRAAIAAWEKKYTPGMK